MARSPLPREWLSFPRRWRTDLIVVHCAATRPDQDIGAAEIGAWHKDRGWSGIGYHHVIRRNGAVEAGRDPDAIGAHALGHNSRSVGICLAGGLDGAGAPAADFTAAQWKALGTLLDDLRHRYPEAAILGHRDLEPGKDCPCFDVGSWLLAAGLSA